MPAKERSFSEFLIIVANSVSIDCKFVKQRDGWRRLISLIVEFNASAIAHTASKA